MIMTITGDLRTWLRNRRKDELVHWALERHDACERAEAEVASMRPVVEAAKALWRTEDPSHDAPDHDPRSCERCRAEAHLLRVVVDDLCADWERPS